MIINTVEIFKELLPIQSLPKVGKIFYLSADGLFSIAAIVLKNKTTCDKCTEVKVEGII